MLLQSEIDYEVHGTCMRLRTPPEFRLSEALVYLTRSPDETLYRVQDDRVLRLVPVLGKRCLLQISCTDGGWLDVIIVGNGNETPSDELRHAVASYVWDWFDLNRNLISFYEMARNDQILSPLVDEFYGLRLIGISDLFEAMCFAVIGQQINLAFAYTLKRRLVQTFGESEEIAGETYWLFPVPERIAALEVSDLQQLQMTQRKSEYLIGIAREMAIGKLSKSALLVQKIEWAKQTLVSIRGVGAWTANYVAMRCLRDATAYPVADVGLQNAVKQSLGLDRKPTPAELVELAKPWSGWEAYATFYLWRSLQGISA